ncbi:MFS general substrate transporter [Cytidiella melzeri]|nr:MFS general substrate transporter [Cytidiella melzeri]
MTPDNEQDRPTTRQELDERAPLLSQALVLEATPLPSAQLAAIYYIKLVIPLSLVQVAPYVNTMVYDLGLRPVGYYSGLLSTAVSVGSFLTVFPWGWLSDRFGRTRIIAFGTLGLGLSAAGFGLSKSFAQALLFRFLSGIFTGYIGVIHSVVGELSNASNQSTAFPFYDIISALGFILGPILGATLVSPAARMPAWFDTPFWWKYQYALPCFVSGAFGVSASILSLSYLTETHPRFSKGKRYGQTEETFPQPETILPSTSEDDEKPPTVKSLLALPVIRALCASQLALGFLASAFNNLFVLMAFSPIEHGGLSMEPIRIASALSIMGFVSIGLKASLPIFLRRSDALTAFRVTAQVWPLTFALMPVLNVIARLIGPERSPAVEALFWIAISIVLFLSRISALAFSIVMILTKDHTPTPSVLATTNSVSELAQMIGIAIGAPFITSLFAFSTTTASNIAGGYLWAIIAVVLATGGDLSAKRIATYRRRD